MCISDSAREEPLVAPLVAAPVSAEPLPPQLGELIELLPSALRDRLAAVEDEDAQAARSAEGPVRGVTVRDMGAGAAALPSSALPEIRLRAVDGPASPPSPPNDRFSCRVASVMCFIVSIFLVWFRMIFSLKTLPKRKGISVH